MPKKQKQLSDFHLLHSLIVNKRVQDAELACDLENDRMVSVHFQGKPFNITVIQAYAPTSNAEEAEVEWFYEDLQGLLELTPKNDVLFTTGGWDAKVGSQEIRITGKFGLGLQQEGGKGDAREPPHIPRRTA